MVSSQRSSFFFWRVLPLRNSKVDFISTKTNI